MSNDSCRTSVKTSKSHIFFSLVPGHCVKLGRTCNQSSLHFHLINYPTGALMILSTLSPQSPPSLFLCQVTKLLALQCAACRLRGQQTSTDVKWVFSLFSSLTEVLCVIRSEFCRRRQLSDDVCVAHQLGEHMAVRLEFRVKQVPLRCQS